MVYIGDSNTADNDTVANGDCQPSENVKYVNITTNYPIEYAEPINGYISPILLVITVVVNGIVIIVLSRPHMRTTTNIVLLNLAISDTLTILFPTLWNIYMYTLGNHYKPIPIVACYAFYVMYYRLPVTFHTASIWLTVLLALQRYICVKYPLMAKSWVTLSRVVKTIVFIGILAIVIHLSRFFDRVTSTVGIKWEGECHQVCKRTDSMWVSNIVTHSVYINVYYWFKVSVVQIIPCALLIYFTWTLTASVYEFQRIRSQILCRNGPNVTQNDSEHNFNSTTIMLVVVVVVFLAVEIPNAILTILHIISSSTNNFLDYNVFKIFQLFQSLFLYLSLPINFVIYCGMSQKFRETFKEVFRCKKNNITTDLEISHSYYQNTARASISTISSVVL